MNGESVTVGFCTYNRHAIIGRAVKAILNGTKLPKEIIVFDSSEGDETEKIIRAIDSPLIHYIHHKGRVILPKARNVVIAKTVTPLLAFVDDDALAEPTYIAAIVEGFKDSAITGVTGPTINVDFFLNPLSPLIHNQSNQTKIYPWGEVRTKTWRWVPPQPLRCYVMSGGNMAYRTKALRDIGGFDENFLNPSFREESDMQIRLTKKGALFLYHPLMSVRHIVHIKGGIEDIEEKQRKYFYLAGKNHRYFSDKHFPKVLSRLSWILWSRNPPCLWLAVLLTLIRRKPYLAWHQGLWEKEK